MNKIQTEPPDTRPNWFRRHPWWTSILIVVAIVAVFGGAGGSDSDDPEPEPTVAEQPAAEPAEAEPVADEPEQPAEGDPCNAETGESGPGEGMFERDIDGGLSCVAQPEEQPEPEPAPEDEFEQLAAADLSAIDSCDELARMFERSEELADETSAIHGEPLLDFHGAVLDRMNEVCEEEPEEEPEPEETVAQKQAVQAAESYLSMGGFSRTGLMEQLTSDYGEGFDKADAEYAIEKLDPDWRAQAVQAAESYLEMGGFSRASLIEQLRSDYGEGFTTKQATHAADEVGL